jgi:hypothetical protein
MNSRPRMCPVRTTPFATLIIMLIKTNDRSYPKSGHQPAALPCLLRANSGPGPAQSRARQHAQAATSVESVATRPIFCLAVAKFDS